MKNKQQPNWQPIESLPMIAFMIDGQSEDIKKQYTNFLEAQHRPYALDYALIERTIKVHSEQLGYMDLYKEQLLKWENEESLTIEQQSEINRLERQVSTLQDTLKNILNLANEIKMDKI